jgi:hypothetical protein
MAILNLSPVGRRSEFAATPDPGRWTGADGTLKQLGRGLRVNEEMAFRDPDEPIRAVPDPWAQARTFGEALLDSRHSMHRRALSQWRGLLALFALQKFYADDYRIEPRKVDLSSDHIFDRVLTTLPPEVAVDGQHGAWTSPWIMLSRVEGREDQPIGMTNPICLVSPGRRSHQIGINAATWAQGDLGDPLKVRDDGELPAPQIIALRAWLLKVAEDLSSFTGGIARALQQLLQDYARDCRTELGGDTRVSAIIGESLRSDLPPLFRSLFRPASLAPIADPSTTSRTQLRLNPDLDYGPLEGVILADARLTEIKGLNPRTCFVWGLWTLAELLRSPRTFKTVHDEAARAGYWLISAADLFTERAVQLANDPLIESHPQGLQDMLLPLRPLALLLQGRLRDTLTGEVAGDRASVTIAVDLIGEEEMPDPKLALTKRFTPDAGEEEGLFVAKADWNVYHASLWPDFRSKVWETYLLRFHYVEARKANMARPHRGLSAGLIAAELAKTGAPYEAVRRLEALNKKEFPAQGRHFDRSERTVSLEYEDIQYSSLPFEALAYLESKGGRAEAAGGLVLIDLPEHNPVLERSTVIAIDFGTTNTVACLGDSDSPPITFRPRLVFPVKFRSPDTTVATLHAARYQLTRFLPPERRTLPTPTVAVEREPYPHRQQLWAFNNIIYFHTVQAYAENDEKQELEKFVRIIRDVKFNLKWSEDPATAEAAKHFLEQFMIMASAEALVTGANPRLTRWRFSVPDALSRDKLEDFQTSLLGSAGRISSEVVETQDGQPLASLYSEGLSAARYMISAADFNSDALNLVLDIGGGTTDITIWDREKIRWRGSMMLAGQNFFTRLIWKNPQILREIGLEAWAALFEAAGDISEDIRREDVTHLAEMLFSGTASEESALDLSRAFDIHWDTRLNGKLGEVLRVAGLVFIGGLAWYLGRVVKELVEREAISPRMAALPAFSLCGRGAGLFKKIHGRRAEDAESPLTRALQVYAKAAGLDSRPMPEVRMTRLAKLEVVRGMLADQSTIDATAMDSPKDAATLLPAALAITYRGGEAVHPDTLVGETEPKGEVDVVDLAELDAFLDELEACAGLRVDLFGSRRGGARGHIANAVRLELEGAGAKKHSARAPEPPFIAALRALVDELAAPAPQREGRISATFRR